MDNQIIYGDLPDKLKNEGILYKGYGIIPKYVMLDIDLTIEAKTIYTYFCSFAGAGETAFPNRDKILKELPMSKDSYYKHFNLLTENGYIEVTQQKSERNIYSNNIYTLLSNPKKFAEAPADTKHNQAYMRIRFGGIKAAGYGVIPKAVMIDTRLSLKAKGIYAYFCAFTGSGNSAFPKKEVIIYHLGITHNTYQKFYKQLIDLNYITAIQRHINGRMSVNDYFLNDNPDINQNISNDISVDIKQDTKKQDTEIKNIKKQDTTKQYTVKQDTTKQYTEKQDTNNNKLNNNKLNNNSSTINHSFTKKETAKPFYPAEPEKIDRMNEKEYTKIILEELLKEKTLPYHFMADDRKLTTAIRILTEWELLSKEKNYNNGKAGIQLSAYITFVEALIEMLSSNNKPLELNGSFVTYSKVYNRITQYIVVVGSYLDGYIYFKDFQEVAINNFIEACSNQKIKNHLKYMKACIWTALQTSNISVDANIAYDFGI